MGAAVVGETGITVGTTVGSEVGVTVEVLFVGAKGMEMLVRKISMRAECL